MTIRYVPLGRSWQTLILDPLGLHREAERGIERRMERLLAMWEGTPYSVTEDKPKVGAFCTAFVVRVLDALYRCAPTPLPLIPQDAAMHDPATARTAIRWFLERYPHHVSLPEGEPVQPGDVVVTGPTGGGPGHVLFVGPRANTLWQCSGKTGVHYTGMSLPDAYRLHCIYRMTDRAEWI